MKIKLNPDKYYVKKVRDKLNENDGYCPCRLEKTAETKCMCAEFRQQFERKEQGYCHCGLYYVDADEI